jgi:phosphoribosylformylglycinamidine (FGAM) synthase-like enzyme
VALAECCIAAGVGAEVELAERSFAGGTGALDAVCALFGESPGGFVVSGEEQALERLASRTHVALLGAVGGGRLEISLREARLSVALEDMARAHTRLQELFA